MNNLQLRCGGSQESTAKAKKEAEKCRHEFFFFPSVIIKPPSNTTRNYTSYYRGYESYLKFFFLNFRSDNCNLLSCMYSVNIQASLWLMIPYKKFTHQTVQVVETTMTWMISLFLLMLSPTQAQVLQMIRLMVMILNMNQAVVHPNHHEHHHQTLQLQTRIPIPPPPPHRLHPPLQTVEKTTLMRRSA